METQAAQNDAVSPRETKAGTSRGLAPAQVAQYREDGFLAPVPAIGAERARTVLTKLEEYEAQRGGSWPGHGLKAHLFLTALDEVVRHPTILDAVESIIGPDILCWSSRLFIKKPGDGGFVSWHQDVTYWGLDVSENILTAWVALSAATRENGVMKFVRGTHRKMVPHREGVASNMLLRGQEVAVEVDESQAVYIELQPGEMSLHHALMFHGSEDNRSNERRVGFAIRYIPTRVKQFEGLPRDSAMLVRGTDRHGNFDLEPSPVRDLDPEAVELHKRVTDTYAEINRQAVEKHEQFLARNGDR